MNIELRASLSPFVIQVEGAAQTCGARAFHVTGPGRESGRTINRTYHIEAPFEKAYSEVFQRLALDFALEIPSGRGDVTLPNADRRITPLLTHNVSDDIVYGYGDPDVLRAGFAGAPPRYYLVVTSNDAPHTFPLLESSDLKAWRVLGCVFAPSDKPSWTIGSGPAEYWAPEIHNLAGTYVLCFCARMGDGTLAIGLARAERPEGPYLPCEEPLIAGGVIDPHLFVEGNAATLFWKHDSNDVWPILLAHFLLKRPDIAETLFASPDEARMALLVAQLTPWARTLHPMERFSLQRPLIDIVARNLSRCKTALERLTSAREYASERAELAAIVSAMRTVIYAQALDRANLALLGEPVEVLANDLAWEAHIVEGEWVEKRGEKYYMFYSGNDFSTPQYGIGVAVADSLLGPYVKHAEPLLTSSDEWWGPGHPSVANGIDDEPVLFFHAYAPGRAGYKEFRALLSAPLHFGDDGTVTLR